MIKCAIGYYNEEEDVFYLSLPESGKHKITTQDLADCVSIAHAEKVKKDNKVKEQYADNNNNSQ